MPVTEEPRYLAVNAQAPQLVAEQLVNGMHVHVAVPSPEVGLSALNRIRVWLPVLGAMSANSPLWDGQDTGFASWRTVIFGRWPVSGPPPRFVDPADYEDRVQKLVSCGVVQDTGQLYWQAARHGLEGVLLGPVGSHRRAGGLVARLMDHVEPALDAAGDTRQVTSLVHRLLRQGTPADRQRHAFAEGGIIATMALISAETTALCVCPARSGLPDRGGSPGRRAGRQWRAGVVLLPAVRAPVRWRCSTAAPPRGAAPRRGG